MKPDTFEQYHREVAKRIKQATTTTPRDLADARRIDRERRHRTLHPRVGDLVSWQDHGQRVDAMLVEIIQLGGRTTYSFLRLHDLVVTEKLAGWRYEAPATEAERRVHRDAFLRRMRKDPAMSRQMARGVLPTDRWGTTRDRGAGRGYDFEPMFPPSTPCAVCGQREGEVPGELDYHTVTVCRPCYDYETGALEAPQSKRKPQ